MKSHRAPSFHQFFYHVVSRRNGYADEPMTRSCLRKMRLTWFWLEYVLRTGAYRQTCVEKEPADCICILYLQISSYKFNSAIAGYVITAYQNRYNLGQPLKASVKGPSRTGTFSEVSVIKLRFYALWRHNQTMVCTSSLRQSRARQQYGCLFWVIFLFYWYEELTPCIGYIVKWLPLYIDVPDSTNWLK